MRISSSLVLLVALASAASAQTVPPALMVQQDGRSVPLGLARLRTDVRIFGSVAQTTTTMTFTNPMPRVMEGDLYFPLPEGATISGYALDIGGAMVDGVAVEKHEARRVFEAVVRQGIDPGLVQWTAGNNFQTRIFPIPAHGSRTVRVEYVTELIGGSQEPAYHLPLKFKEKLQEFAIRIEVVKPAAAPKVAKGGLANFAFGQWRDSYVAETKLEDVSLTEDLVIALPAAESQPVMVEKADDGQIYFAIQDFPTAPSPGPAAPPPHVVLFWDASGSRGSGDHNREVALVRACFEQWLAAGAPASIGLDLVLLRNAASKPQRIDLGRANLAALTEMLDKVAYDGGTQLGAIGPLPGVGKPDLYLLVTDGISTFGRDEPAALDAPLYILSADSGANHAFLHGLAMTTGGRYFNLAQLKDDDVLAGIGRPAWSFLVAKVDEGQAEAVCPSLAQPVAGRFLLAGKLTGETAMVSIQYGLKNGTPQNRSFKISRADAAEGTLLRRLWAQKKLAELMVFQKRNKPEITALGKQMGLVTPYTSLLVLDSLEQYVEHEIVPPKSLAAMREEYHRRIDTIEHQQRKQKADKLEEVVRIWHERVKWWEAEYKYAKDFKYKEDARDGEGQGGRPHFSRSGGPRGEGRPRHPAAKTELRPAEAAPAAAEPPAPPARPAAPPSAKAAPAEAPAAAPGDMDTLVLRRANPALVQEALKQTFEDRPVGREPGIVIKEWSPDMPYLKDLRAAKKTDAFAVYMKNRARHGASPAFFLDCADYFREAGDPQLALQVLSNIAELELEEAALLRVLGHRLVQIGQLDLAVETFQQVLDLRPEEPQSCRDLALTLAHRAEQAGKEGSQRPEAIRADFARAIDLLVRVVMSRWDGRFPEIEVIALEEVNRIIPLAKAAGVSDIPLDPRLVKLLDVDIRIVMTWHADNTDIDLWVTEPSGEKAYYGHNRTTIGGLVSRDFTQGYGPEEYLVRKAPPGMYRIEANYFGTRATRLLGAVTVQVDVLTNYGQPNQQRKSLTIRLTDARETIRIGEIEF